MDRRMYVIGLDVGTTGAKAVVVDRDGQLHGQGYRGYGLVTAEGGIAEQRAEDWWEASVAAIREACAHIDTGRIRAISLSTQGASSVLVDERGKTIGRAITWMDKRAYQEAQDLSVFGAQDYFYKKSGWELAANLDACKLLWLKRNQPGQLEKAHKFISTLEYMNYRLVGAYVIDPTNAAIRQLSDIENDGWNTPLFAHMDVPASLMPAIKPAGTLIGRLCSEACAMLGLAERVEVYNGAHDQYCCAIGSGSIRAGDLLLGTGTAWVVMSITKKPLFTASRISPARHVVDGLWGALSSISCGGASLDWWRAQAGDISYGEIDSYAAAHLGEDAGLLFYPYFIGTGCPQWEESARGTFIGLELRHTKLDMAMAVMEGLVFQTALLLEEYESCGASPDSLRIMGGAAKSAPWVDMLRAVSDRQVVRVHQTDAAAMGAAVIAAVGCGMYADYTEAVESMVSYEALPKAHTALRDAYQKKYRRYKACLSHLRQMYKECE